jgi:hypothetical protein
MNISNIFGKMPSALVVLCVALVSQSALALDMQVYPLAIGQSAYTSSVRLGHTVYATTSFNRLVAGGTFLVHCADARVGTIPGQRTLSSAQSGRNTLYVTIPETLPTTRMLPGFTALPKGTTISCQYDWTAKATEAQYSIGSNGFGITIGGEERNDGSSIPFTMTREDNDGEGCIQY